MMECVDRDNLTRDDLAKEYNKLLKKYEEMRLINDVDAQKIHELKRALGVATAAESYLSQELEQLNCIKNKYSEEDFQHLHNELDGLRKRYSKLETAYDTLQQECNSLTEENRQLGKKLTEVLKANEESRNENDEKRTTKEMLARLQIMEKENFELLRKLEEVQECSTRNTMALAECEKNNDILRDQVNCLEENLQFKRGELEEKLQMLESAQEQLGEANAKIALLTATNVNQDRKGNSLFAEVDDQRQAMKQLLIAQKRTYLEMKKAYTESEHEIRRLKRENTYMLTELKACTSIFCNADKSLQDKLYKRIGHLIDQNDQLKSELNWTQGRLKELAIDKGAPWLESLLDFCKKEKDDLKGQLYAAGIQNASLEEQLRNALQDMARWRFESLKSRCVLLNREDLLNEHKIAFKPVQAIEFNINEKEVEEAKPRIANESLCQVSEAETLETKENHIKSCPTLLAPTSEDAPTTLLKNEEIPVDTAEASFCVNNKFSKLGLKPPTPMKHSHKRHVNVAGIEGMGESQARSILIKQHDSGSFQHNDKNVKFCNEADSVHNISCNAPSTSNQQNVVQSSPNKTTLTRQIKNNIQVRRIFVPSKPN